MPKKPTPSGNRRDTKRKRRGRVGVNDTLVSGVMLGKAVSAILARTRLDRSHDIPYLAGYSRDGKTIFIDRDLPKSFSADGRRVSVDRFLILHEAVEKSLLDRLGLIYQHAHQIALRAEQAAVRAAGIDWRKYDRFMQQYIKEAYDDLDQLPTDLDIKPYHDEHETDLLRRMQESVRNDRKKRRAAKTKGRKLRKRSR